MKFFGGGPLQEDRLFFLTNLKFRGSAFTLIPEANKKVDDGFRGELGPVRRSHENGIPGQYIPDLIQKPFADIAILHGPILEEPFGGWLPQDSANIVMAFIGRDFTKNGIYFLWTPFQQLDKMSLAIDQGSTHVQAGIGLYSGSGDRLSLSLNVNPT